MIAMKMAHEHGIDIVRLKPEPAHADQRRNPAIDEKGRGGRPHEERGLKVAARAEGIAAAENGQLHRPDLIAVSPRSECKRTVRDFSR